MRMSIAVACTVMNGLLMTADAPAQHASPGDASAAPKVAVAACVGPSHRRALFTCDHNTTLSTTDSDARINRRIHQMLADSASKDHRWEGFWFGAASGGGTLGMILHSLCRSSGTRKCFMSFAGGIVMGGVMGGTVGGLLGSAMPKDTTASESQRRR